MIPKGLLTQIGIVILAGGIILTYVKPTFTTIAENQDQIAVYQTEIDKVNVFNQKLNDFTSRVNAIDSMDKERLLAYMPDTVDTIAVPRTIEAIAREAGVDLVQVTYEGPVQVENTQPFFDPAAVAPAVVDTSVPTAEMFAVELECTYGQLKQFLQLLEQNEFPIEVSEMEVSGAEAGGLRAEFSVVTYRHSKPLGNNTLNQVTP